MIRTIFATALLLGPLAAAADSPGRIHRTEVIPYDLRRNAEQGDRTGLGALIPFAPQPLAAEEEGVLVGQTVDIPYAWTDGEVYLHLENVGTAYTLAVNGTKVAEVESAAVPAEFRLTPAIREGRNVVLLALRRSRAKELDTAPAARPAFENCYLYAQNKRSIRDFEIALVPDTAGRDFAMLDLKIVAQNGFNYDEPVEVGYDIYSPQGKLLDFDMREVTIPGRSVDTVRFSPFIYHAFENKWTAGGAKNPPLYKVMLFTRRNGAYKEYMPLKLGFADARLAGGRFENFGREQRLAEARYNAAADRKTTLAELKALKAQGRNTLLPDAPQPAWFYDLCDELGLWVIDRADIAASSRRADRCVGGTPSNDPALADEYLERVQAMYYRSRNHTCILAYALGGDAGNGYNMYKAYEWLKSVERRRPVIYADADGEWNSDL